MSYDREKLSYIVGMRIREIRNQRKTSQEALALNSGIHPDFLGKLERGERCPSVDTLYKICVGLKIPLSQLLDFDTELTPSCKAAKQRICAALNELSDDEAVAIADIVDDVISFKHK